MGRSIGEVLLKLLEHTDPSAIEILVEPEVLLALLRQHQGLTDDAIRERLKTQSPGELLLGLFEQGRTTDELFGSIDPELKARLESKVAEAKTRQKRSGETEASGKTTGTPKHAAYRDSSGRRSNAHRAVPMAEGLVLAVVVAVGMIPAMAFMVSMNASLWILVNAKWVIATVFVIAGTAGALIAKEHRFWLAFLACGLGAVGGGAALAAYLVWGTQGRTTVLKIELGLAFFVGLLPGLVLFAVSRKFPKAAESRPT